jgi:CRISPR-associated protein Csd1
VDVVASEFGARNEIGLGQCLVSGEIAPIAKLHPATPVPGSQATAKLHSFNLEPFGSYGNDKGANAPVSNKATFEYTTALNHLLSSRGRPSKRQCLQVGDAWTVFWSDRPTVFETGVVDIFGDPIGDDPDSDTGAIVSLFKAIEIGLLENNEGGARFFVLGLAPNIARIAIRYWHHGTVAEMAARIKQYFEELKIVHGDGEREHLSISAILASTANDTKFDSKKPNLVYHKGKYFDVKPNLGGELMHSIFADLTYPQTVLAAVVRRIRAEHEVTYPRVALIKACINRDKRKFNRSKEEELKMSLDENNTNAAYRLGRLFAVLERIQEEANGKATIRERYYGAASGTPVVVFPTLLKLKNHHIGKLENKGRAINLEKLIGAIVQGVNEFPAQLDLKEQGRFAIGYYHQKQHPSTYKSQGE